MPDPLDPVPAVLVQPIGYSSPVQAVGRPGAVTTIGVISVVVGSISILTSGIFGLWSVGVLMYASALRTISVSSPTSVVAIKPGSERRSDSALSIDERGIVIDGMTHVRPLTPERRRQLEELLAQNGKNVLVLRGDSLTAERVAANVSDSGRLTSGSGQDGPDYYTLGEGRIEVSDDHASFFPNSGEAVRVSAPDLADDGATTAPATALSQAQIQAIVRRVQSLGGTMNATQRTTLVQSLNGPSQQFVVPTGDGSDPSAQVLSATTMANGVLFGSTSHGTTQAFLQIDKNGQTTSNVMNGTAAGAGLFTSASGKPALSFAGISLVVIGIGLNLALAVYLLICGILVLRHSPRGARLHWIYALLKIPVALLTAGAIAWVCYQFMQSTAMANRFDRVVVYLVVPAIIGCAYPIALLIVLQGRRVREYYGGIRGNAE